MLGEGPNDSQSERLQGSVERVTFHSEESGFCVLRVKAKGQRELVTLVGTAADGGDVGEEHGPAVEHPHHQVGHLAQPRGRRGRGLGLRGRPTIDEPGLQLRTRCLLKQARCKPCALTECRVETHGGADGSVGQRRVVNPLEAQQELGAGGMATVYLAHDLKHDRKVAVKVLRPELAAALG
ncbi:MAG: hypothetical protein P8Y25_11855, partial [Chromatiaceae bacterium]